MFVASSRFVSSSVVLSSIDSSFTSVFSSLVFTSSFFVSSGTLSSFSASLTSSFSSIFCLFISISFSSSSILASSSFTIFIAFANASAFILAFSSWIAFIIISSISFDSLSIPASLRTFFFIHSFTFPAFGFVGMNLSPNTIPTHLDSFSFLLYTEDSDGREERTLEKSSFSSSGSVNRITNSSLNSLIESASSTRMKARIRNYSGIRSV